MTVSNIESGDDTISFDVSEPGVPVLVKTSYFPNWQVEGGQGPLAGEPQPHGGGAHRAPTSSLHYGRTGVDWAGIVLTVVGLVGPGRPGPLEARAAPGPRRPGGGAMETVGRPARRA